VGKEVLPQAKVNRASAAFEPPNQEQQQVVVRSKIQKMGDAPLGFDSRLDQRILPLGLRRAFVLECKPAFQFTDANRDHRVIIFPVSNVREFVLRRRTAITNMVNSGIPEKVVMMISGHRTAAVFKRYHIVVESALEDAAEFYE